MAPSPGSRDIRQFLNSSGFRRPDRDLSKWLTDARNSFSCSCVIPLLSLVRIWFSTSLIVLLTEVTNCSQPTRRVSMVYWVYLFSKTKLSWICWLILSSSSRWDFSANCLLRASLFSCFFSSSCRVWSLWGTKVFTSFHLLWTSLPVKLVYGLMVAPGTLYCLAN